MASLNTTPSCSGGAIFSVHPDVMKTNVLARLDGPDLVSVTCASSGLHALSNDDRVWRHICAATWPSTGDPRVRHVISLFPFGHRSFFSDSFPDIPNHRVSAKNPTTGELESFSKLFSCQVSTRDRDLTARGLCSLLKLPSRQTSFRDLAARELESFPGRQVFSSRDVAARELISVVDVFYKGKIVFSRVHVSETRSSWFACSPFRVDLVGRTDPPAIPIRHGGESDTWLHDLDPNLTLTWILIDPARTRAANIVSGRSPVSVTRHWMTRHVEVRYGTVLSPGKAEAVNISVVVTCGGKDGGDVHVTEISMHVEDLDGKVLNGRDSLVILRGAIEGERRRRREGQNGKIAFEEFEEMKVRKRKAMQRMERTLDLVCIVTAVTCFMTFLSFVFFG